jgi:ABC-type transport system involved in multi-copper enzyme maturation permease subunit
MEFLRAPLTWLRLTFRWSTSTQTWQERIGDVALLAGLVSAAAITLLVHLEWWQALAVWAVCFVPALLFNVVGWLKVFGPVLYYDMVRQARRSRFIILRLLYALLLVFLLFCVVTTHSGLAGASSRQAADIADSYFNVFMVAQFITVVLLTPAYVAGAIADEKDRKTLEFMLATDLLNREIVLSKLGSRLANLGLIVLTGLPILSILQFLGGVDPNMILAGFAVTAMTIVGQAGLSILCSVVCRRPREAIALAYLGVLMYYLVALLLFLGLTIGPTARIGETHLWFAKENPPTVFDAIAVKDPPTLGDAVAVYNSGNLVAVILEVQKAGAGGTLATRLPDIVRDYTIFHGLIAVLCVGLAVARLRRVALAQTYGKAIKSRTGWRIWGRPAVGSYPMVWKELHCEGAGRSNWIAWVIFTVLLAGTFVPAALIIGYHVENFYRPVNRWDNLTQSMNIWMRFCNVIIGSLTLLAVAVRASTSISTERDKQTFDTLLSTPVDSTSILYAKWVGSLFSARFGVVWLALTWAVGIVTGGLHFVALPFVIAAWVIYAAFVATLGLWFSMRCRSSLRATVLTILSTIALSIGHWVPWLCCGPLMGGARMFDAMQHLASAQAGVLTPPFVMGFLAFSSDEFNHSSHRMEDQWYEFAGFCFVGLIAWSIATAVLYAATSIRFRTLTHRDSVMRPDRTTWMRRGGGPERRRRPPVPMAPWAPPTGAVLIEESSVEDVEPLDHDEAFGEDRERP